MKVTTSIQSIPECFRIQLIMCQIALIWPVKVTNIFSKLLVRLYFGTACVSMALASVGLLLKAVTSNNLVDRSEAIDIFTLVSSALYKLLFFTINHQNFKLVVDKCGHFQRHLPSGWTKLIPIFSFIHPITAFIIISFWGFCPLFNYILGEYTWEKLPLPINTLAPDLNGIMFGLTYIWGYFSLIFSCHIYMAVDLYFFTAIHIVNGALETLRIKLETMKDKISQKKIDGKEPRHEFLKEWVDDHVEIAEYIRHLDMTFRSMIVADVLHAIISLSFAMLQSTASQNLLDWIKGTFFIIYCFVHQYLNSYFGQRLIDQQEAVRNAMADVPWYEGSVPMMKTVLIISNGVLKPVRLSAWRMYFLQYATFVEFVRTMASWFMVLRQINGD